MNNTEFELLSAQLQGLCKSIPSHWGRIQNNTTDSKIDLFKIKSWNELQVRINSLTANDQNYFKYRWFLWQCSKVDEHLFASCPSVSLNPDRKSQQYDLQFCENTRNRFDLKGTVVPQKFRKDFTFEDEPKLIAFYYANQSTGVRSHYQNRLFVVHHSFKAESRTIYLRCHWKLKIEAYRYFAQQLCTERIRMCTYNHLRAKCIFIIETKEGGFQFHLNS